MSSLVRPPYLQPGDTIAIVPTARAIEQEELQDGIALAERWGLKVRLGQGIGRKHFQQAGTAEERAADLQAAIDDPAVKAIWCARGGYGTVHLLEHLRFDALLTQPKWLVGFSDITVLHNALHNLGVCSLHAQMPFMVGAKTPETRETLRKALFGEDYAITTPAHAFNRNGEATGVLIGGNLSVLCSLRGTSYDIDPRGKILLLEDLDELLYHLDRMVMNLQVGGWFSGLAGLVLGHMIKMHDLKETDPFGQHAEEIISRAIGNTSYPVCFNFPADHDADNRALVLGQKTKLSVTSEGATLSYASSFPTGEGRDRV
ncbi:MAG: LD-carboxypeptidase [Flavobacteriales bacterium]|nr:MAG: LD-carboxypeptidase [Flavobacteriales bacterium]